MIDQPFKQLVDSIAQRTPTPGGGATAALSAAMGTSLFLMVVRFSRGKKATADRDGDLQKAESLLDDHLQRILPMAERDCAAFDQVSAAYGLAKESDEDKAVRAKAIEEAMHGAMVVPEEMMCMVRDVFAALDGVVDCVGKNIVSDLGSGSELLRAAAECAYMNVRINANFLKDRALAETTLARALAVRDEILRHHDSLRGHVDLTL